MGLGNVIIGVVKNALSGEMQKCQVPVFRHEKSPRTVWPWAFMLLIYRSLTTRSFLKKFQTAARYLPPFITAHKRFDGGELQDGMFTFELLNDYNEVLQTATARADGSVTFDPIVFTRADLGYHIYRIREVTEGVNGVKYDRHSSFVQIFVYIDENDELKWKYEVRRG